MNAAELARMVDNWSDALNMAEVVANPFLRVTDRWDLHDWQSLDVDDGLRFERCSPTGQVLEAVEVVIGDNCTRQEQQSMGEAPIWTVIVGLEDAHAGAQVACATP